jgi:hypothetical protein
MPPLVLTANVHEPAWGRCCLEVTDRRLHRQTDRPWDRPGGQRADAGCRLSSGCRLSAR